MRLHIEEMDGLGALVEQALRAAQLPFEFAPGADADLQVSLVKMHSEYGEILYRQKLGRTETHRLELRAGNKTLAWHAFALAGPSRRAAVQEFAHKVKKAWSRTSSTSR